MSKIDFLIFGILLLSFSKAERFDGIVVQENGVAFLGKFCFDVNVHSNPDDPVGYFSLHLSTRVNFSNMEKTYIALFDDQKESWPLVYMNINSMQCSEILSTSINFNVDNKHLIEWTKNSDGWNFNMERSAIIQNLRPRWWYITVVNCDGVLKDTTFKIHAWQSQSSQWNQEFGVNEQGLNTLYLLFFFYYVIFVVIHTIGTYRLRKQLKFTHPLVRLFYVTLLLQFLVVFARMLHYAVFAQNGWGIPQFAKFAEIAEVFAQAGFLITLMLLAKGWTINPGKIDGSKWILLFSFLYLFGKIAILFWRYDIQNPAAPEMPLGLAFFLYMMLTFWFIWSFWFTRVIYSSWSSEDNPLKKRLFLKLAVIYFPWFFGLPFITLLKFALSPWVRDKVIASMTIIISTIGYSFLAYLLWPTWAEEYFLISPSGIMMSNGDTYERL